MIWLLLLIPVVLFLGLLGMLAVIGAARLEREQTVDSSSSLDQEGNVSG